MNDIAITIQLTGPEAQALVALMDAGVRSTGIQSAANAAVLLKRIEDATQAAMKAAQEEKAE